MRKKIILFAMALISALSFAPGAYATGGITVSSRSLSLIKGGSGSFSVVASNAAGRVDVTSSNTSVATVSTSSIFLDNNSQSVTVTAVGAGSATISVKIVDAATYDEEVLSGTVPVSVTVSNPKSDNNNLKSLTVAEGYTVTKKDSINYALTVANSVSKVTIQATAEHAKATVSGTGAVNLKVGTNKFTITVKAENGSAKNYYLTVTRKSADTPSQPDPNPQPQPDPGQDPQEPDEPSTKKDKYYLPDIDEALKDETNPVSIIIRDGDVISGEDLRKIEESSKTVRFVKYKDGDAVNYSFDVDGGAIKDAKDIEVDPLFTTSDKGELDDIAGDGGGVYVNVGSENLPDNSRVRLNMSDKYKDGDELYVYAYDDADAKLLMGPVEVKDGMVEFDLGKSTKYFVTKERIGEAGGIPAGFVIAGLVGLGALLIVGAVILIMAMKKKKKNDSNDLGDAAGGISGEIGTFGPTPGVGGPDFDAGPNSGTGGIFG